MTIMCERGDPTKEVALKALIQANDHSQPVMVACPHCEVVLVHPGDTLEDIVERYQEDFPMFSPDYILDRRSAPRTDSQPLLAVA